VGVGILLGVMAIFLAGLNRRLLIDTSDQDLDRAAEAWLRTQGIEADVRSLILNRTLSILFVRADGEVPHTVALGEAMKEHLASALGRRPEAVYWKFKRALG
jgi:hypothetical protein